MHGKGQMMSQRNHLTILAVIAIVSMPPSCYKLNVPSTSNLHVKVLPPKVMMFGHGAIGRYSRHKGVALMNRISAVIKQASESIHHLPYQQCRLGPERVNLYFHNKKDYTVESLH